jgi:hypothetical protein
MRRGTRTCMRDAPSHPWDAIAAPSNGPSTKQPPASTERKPPWSSLQITRVNY